MITSILQMKKKVELLGMALKAESTGIDIAKCWLHKHFS
jgi:hypothetical protein